MQGKKNLQTRRRTGPGRLSAKETEELPDRLLDAALGLFTTNGFGQTTMEQIARQAGASTKTIYSRYPNKMEILMAVMRRLVERTVAGHAAVMPRAEDTEPRRFLVGFCLQIGKTIAGDGAALTRLVFSEAMRFPEFRRLHEATIGRGVATLKAALQHWHSQGLLPQLTDAEESASLLLSMAVDRTRVLVAVGLMQSPEDIEAQVKFAVDLFLRGVGYESV